MKRTNDSPARAWAAWRTVLCAFVLTAFASAQTVEFAPVVSKPSSRVVELPGEFTPFLSVSLHAKVSGYVEKILVDRGSVVKEGQLLAELSAPELKAQIAEAESKVQAADSDRVQAEAQAAAAESTYERLKQASATPGAVAGNELILAEKQVAAAKALVLSRQQGGRAATAAVSALKDMEAYLKITAPFDGVVTDRLVHPGALVGPGAGQAESAMLVIQQISHLRLTVAVPEESAGGIVKGAKVDFRVPAYADRTFSGVVARNAHALDAKTRTMAVELDVFNRDEALSPGMYATVKWPVRRTNPSLFVPKTSVVTTTERTFVVREKSGHAEWVDVKKGAADGDLIEVIGALQAGDKVVKRATDEMRDGAPLAARAK
jgi:membrane fusion protein, multidrug efflux system